MKLKVFGAILVAVAASGLSACGPSGEASGPTITSVVESFDWYPPCATSPITIEGKLYWPLPMDAPPVDESKYPLPSVTTTALPLRIDRGFGRVAPPGPGDDVGTVILYSDGMARFESESGNVAWLTLEEQEYGYVC